MGIDDVGSRGKAEAVIARNYHGNQPGGEGEVSQDFRLDDVKLPHRVLGEVTTEPQLMLTAGGEEILTESLTALERSWAGTFREVLG